MPTKSRKTARSNNFFSELLERIEDSYIRSVDFIIYEKNENIGGTWFMNRYPGCACDVPSHAYAFNFALNVQLSPSVSLKGDSY
jgi:hypothetical protein